MRALFVGEKQFLYIPSIFMVSFGEIRYENSERLFDGLRI